MHFIAENPLNIDWQITYRIIDHICVVVSNLEQQTQSVHERLEIATSKSKKVKINNSDN